MKCTAEDVTPDDADREYKKQLPLKGELLFILVAPDKMFRRNEKAFICCCYAARKREILARRFSS
jgi:hypothetical protein